MPLLWGDVVLILLLFPCAPALPVAEDVEFIDFEHERSLPGINAKEEIRVVWSESQNTEGSYFKKLSQLLVWESEPLASPSPWPHPEDDDEQVEARTQGFYFPDDEPRESPMFVSLYDYDRAYRQETYGNVYEVRMDKGVPIYEPPLILLTDEGADTFRYTDGIPSPQPRPHVREGPPLMQAVEDWTPRMKREYLREQERERERERRVALTLPYGPISNLERVMKRDEVDTLYDAPSTHPPRLGEPPYDDYGDDTESWDWSAQHFFEWF